jgi:hypothetical protein
MSVHKARQWRDALMWADTMLRRYNLAPNQRAELVRAFLNGEAQAWEARFEAERLRSEQEA